MINNDTGEIMANNFIVDQLEDTRKKIKGAKKRELDGEFKRIQEEVLGNFVFFLFKDIDKLQEKLPDSDLVKFIYLGTYVRADGSLKLDNNKTHIKKKMLSELLGIKSKGKVNTFYNTMIEKKLIGENGDGFLYINPSFFFRGKDTQYKKLTGKKLTEFTRLYTKSTRELYKETNSNKHEKLAMAYKLLPFCNWKYNILCNNPEETDREYIEPINLSEILVLLGWKKTHMKKLINDLLEVKIQGYNLFLRIGKDGEIKNDYILVNPLGYYRGNDVLELEVLMNYFHIVK